jgi:hypothetical protein
MEVLLLFSSFTALACSFAAFAYAEFASMVPVQEVHTYSYVLIENLDYWLGLNHGICNWEYHGGHILE